MAIARDATMNTVSGKIIVQETRAGLSDLLVSLFHLDALPPRGRSDVETKPPTVDDAEWLLSSTSLGSDISKNGEFHIEYERPDTGDGSAKAPHVAIVVFTADISGIPDRAEILHVGSRFKAGRNEKFLISVPIERAKAAGLPVDGPTAPPNVVSSTITNRIRNRLSARTEIQTDIRGIVRDKLESEREARKQKRDVVRRYVRRKGTAPFRKPDGSLVDNYVREGENVSGVNRRVMIRNLADTINKAQLKGHLDLNKDELNELKNDAGDIPDDLSNEEIEALVFGDEGAVADSIHRSLIEAYCRDHTMPYDKCGPAAGGGNGDSDPDDEPAPDPTDPVPATLEDFKKNLSLILDTVTQNSLAPHHHTLSRPTPGQIQSFIQGLELTSGPADVPALFDFESLQIAFEHTWHQLFDTEWEDRVIARLSEVDAAGGDVEDPTYEGVDLIEAIGIESKRLAEAYVELGAEDSDSPSVLYSWYSGIVEGLDDAIQGGLSVSGLGDIFGGRFGALNQFMRKLEELKNRDYEFTAFGADGGERAINFGILLTYLQEWTPLSYSLGELVKTIPLAPKEVRRFKSKRVTKKSYVEKRSEASESKYNTESQETSRDISKIVRNAKFDTSFTLTTKVGGKIPGFGSAGATSTFKTNFEKSSMRSKESFREAVKKASQEFKNSNKLEVTASEEEQFEFEESGEISNPNEELAMTCLFYELQRRYRVSEHIHRLTSVILVAQEIPKPSQINDQWIICHDWILRRVLLDDSFLPPLEYVSTADHLAEKTVAKDLEANMEQQQGLVRKLEQQLFKLKGYELPDPRGLVQNLVAKAYDREYGREWREDESRVRAVFGQDVAEQFAETRRAREEVELRLAREATALQEATAVFHEAYREYAAKMIQVHRLRLHIKKNILYYMQAIWEHELPDERMMRLQNTKVPIITGDLEYALRMSGRSNQPVTWQTPVGYGVKAALELSEDTQPLSEVADLANPLGYFGNYAIFPLNEPNLLTKFMAAPYMDKHQGVRDPDDFGNYTLSDLDRYVCCLKERLDPETFETLKADIDEVYKARLSDPRPDSEEIVVPTESLFIEILPSTYSVLENFKLQHRAVDVQKAVADVVAQQLENLRLTGRLISDQFGDPDTEKVIIKETDDDITVDTD